MAAHEIKFHDYAAAEYDAAFDWYLARSPDAASRFDTEVERALQQIADNPQRWATGESGTRRYLLRTFPFILDRELSEKSVHIIAVAHTSRKPGYWQQRV